MEKIKINQTKTLILLIIAGFLVLSFIVLKIMDLTKKDINSEDNPVVYNFDLGEVFNSNKSGKIKKATNFQELFDFVEKNKKEYSDNYLMKETMVDQSLGLSEAVTSENKTAESDFSSTNIQVLGVDEADIIKTDGNFIYALSENNLYIIEAQPAEEAKILHKMVLEGNPHDIYIKDNKLVVFGQSSDFYLMEKMAQSSMIWPGPSGQVFLQVFDISDKKNPVEKRNLKVDGSYFNSRLINDHLYFIVNNFNYYGTDILPRVFYKNEELSFNCQDGLKCFQPDVYYFDTDYDSFYFSSIFSINISNDAEEMRSSFYLLPQSQGLYVSPNNIYISYTKYLNEYDLESSALLEIIYSRLSADDRATIEEIKKVADKILSPSEKKVKIRRILDLYLSFLTEPEKEVLLAEVEAKIKATNPNLEDEIETSIIYKLAVFNGIIEPISYGVVSGSILNQFSMDEYDGYFRLATTRNSSWSKYSENTNSYNNVYILEDDMQIAGKIKNIAPGESIYSVRFLKDKAYVVTFEKTDPLFSIDLEDPYQPKVLGELKVDGFSNYLHPYGDDKLIGLGRDTELSSSGQVTIKGLKLSLFDVSGDVPLELDSYVIGNQGSESIALYDHRAFLFSGNKNILVVPATFRDSSKDNFWGKTTFDGFLVFQILENKLVLKGQIEHLNNAVSSWDGFLNSSNRRSLYIGENLYSFSNKLLKINKIEDLSELTSVNLD